MMIERQRGVIAVNVLLIDDMKRIVSFAQITSTASSVIKN